MFTNEGTTCWNCSKLAKCLMYNSESCSNFQSYLSLREFCRICGIPVRSLYCYIKLFGFSWLEKLAKKNGLAVKIEVSENGTNHYIIYKATNDSEKNTLETQDPYVEYTFQIVKTKESSFCLDHCPHSKVPCNGICKEYIKKFEED